MGGETPEKRKNFKLRALLANTSEGAVVVDASGTIVLMNEAAELLLNQSRGEVVGKSLDVLEAPMFGEEVQTYIGNGPKAKVRYLSLTADGKTLRCKMAPFEGPTENGVVVSIRDETELVRQQERAEAILSSTGDGLIVFAPDNRITYINPSACDMLGLKVEEVINEHKTTSVLLAQEPPDPSEAAPCWEMLSCDREDCPAYRSDDLRCWLVSGTLCRDGEKRTFRE